ncbi:MAG: Maf family protein [Acidobacteria bacterium]|jgi:septum formation protein|nr:Maf family protein [Acidobacteriota bacterium]
MQFILASSSPRRKELLKMLGIAPRILISNVDENRLPEEQIGSYLRRVSIAKGQAVYKEEYLDIPIISSDTIVWINNSIIGKPADREEAAHFLRTLSGRVHEVLTGVAILYRGNTYYEYACTGVEFSEISEEELTYYLDNEDYMDKAGAYAIQGLASVFVKRIDGCYFNVMGFPVNTFYQMMKRLGIELLK